MVTGDGGQPRLAIIFRRKSKRIREDERLAWHPNVDVYFQENAWVDTKTCMDWTNNTLKKCVDSENLKFLLLCDNLDAQCQRESKEAIHVLNGLVWYGLKNATDLWQVVDAGVAQLLKVLTGL